MSPRISYNSPVTLTFALAAVAVHLLSATLFRGLNTALFAVGPTMSLVNPLDYWRLVSHVLGHQSFEHLFVNLTLILLLGPILEEKYGSAQVLEMIVVTALVTGVLNVLLFPTGLMGASGIVFMLIILVSIVDVKKGSIPLTFILVVCIFLGREVLNGFGRDGISQTAHVVGGLAGAAFGFFLASAKRAP